MTVFVKDISAFLEAWAPPEFAFAWDKVGLQTGRPDTVVTGVLVCLTVTRETFQAAQRAGANMIVSHHPLVWSPLKHLRGDDPHAQLCVDIAAAGMASFAAHTNLDLAPGGVNDVLAERLGLQDSQPLFPAEHLRQVKLVTFVPAGHVDALRSALARAGAGVIGDYTHCSFYSEGTGSFLPGASTSPSAGKKGVLNHEPELRFEMLVSQGALDRVVGTLLSVHPYEEPAYDLIPLANSNPGLGLGRVGTLKAAAGQSAFAARVRKALGVPYLVAYRGSRARVRRIAVLGGSGGGSVAELPGEVDVFVTGDIGYHDAQAATMRGITCLDAGHAGTELPVLDAVSTRLRRAFKGLPVRVYRERTGGTVVC